MSNLTPSVRGLYGASAPELLSLAVRAELGLLEERLSVSEIAALHPDGDDFARVLLEQFAIYLQRSGAETTPGDTRAADPARGPGLRAEVDTAALRQTLARYPDLEPDPPAQDIRNGEYVSVHRDDLRALLEHWNAWPLDPQTALSAWWASQPEALAEERRRRGDLDEPSDAARVGGAGGSDPLAVFREMGWLTPGEISLTFRAGDLVEVSARGTSRRVGYDTLGLVDKRTGKLNKHGRLLLGLGGGHRSVPKGRGNDKAVSRLRKTLFWDRLGVRSDPFQTDWYPHFTVRDERSAPDQRAKREATHVPYDDNRRGTTTEAADGADGNTECSYEREDDDADRWLAENDPDARI